MLYFVDFLPVDYFLADFYYPSLSKGAELHLDKLYVLKGSDFLTPSPLQVLAPPSSAY